MKQFDFAKLKEINDLDFEQIAIWPFEVKTVVALFIVIVVSGISYFGIVSPKLPSLDQAEAK